MTEESVAQPDLDDVLEQRREKAKVSRAVKAIRQAHADGRESRKEHGRRLYGSRDATIPKFAAKHGQRRDALERARQFADVFDQKSVDQLCRECWEHKFPLGVTMIYRVLPLGDAGMCMLMLQRAISGKWTIRRLIAEIRKRPGAISHTGRPRTMPNGPEEARQQVGIRMGPAVSWLKDLNSHMGGQLGAGLQKKIGKAVSALDALMKAAS